MNVLFHQPQNCLSNYSYNVCIYKNIKWNYHFHKNFELIYVISGEVECTINGKTDVLRANEFGLCLSNEIHAYHTLGESKAWVGVFSGDFVHAFEKQTKNKTGEHFKFRCRPEIENYLKTTLLTKECPETYILKSCLYAVCAEYCNNVKLKELSTKSDLLMRTITDYIANNFQNKLDLADLAKISGYDYCYISRYFHKIFHMSFNDYLNSYRLEHALMLLTETDKSVTDIAYESGFQSIRSFNHNFKKMTGKSPTQYRDI
ncbi:MAG: helix-turn-helix transcriptional regulator [Tyzzerella sp.]|nr:helix-turn-helix transcriptional regulator [Tyzzerella sp.]